VIKDRLNTPETTTGKDRCLLAFVLASGASSFGFGTATAEAFAEVHALMNIVVTTVNNKIAESLSIPTSSRTYIRGVKG
jgi:hypothetical protein